MDRIDFQNSSLTWLTEGEESYGRFALESLCSLRNELTGTTNAYCLGAEVLVGYVYGNDELVIRPNYLFQIAASRTDHTIFRTYLWHRPERDSAGKNAGLFTEMNLRVVKRGAVVLHDFAAIEQHFHKHSQFSARVSLPQDGTTVVEIEFPVKHMNLHRTRGCFQVETGPILFPTKIHARWDTDLSIPEFNAAFIHFNRFDGIEMTLKVPTRMGVRSTRFYSETMKLAADVSLLASDQNWERKS